MSLPLPLAPFEDYMLFDDRPTHPMCFFLRLKFSGECDAIALDVALRNTLKRHPLLNATAQKESRIRYTWQPLEATQASVRWLSDSESTNVDSTSALCNYLDLQIRSGLEVIGTQTDLGTELLFQFHHSCCDGIGGLQFIEDVLIAYHQEINGSATDNALSKQTDNQLQRRAKLGLSGWQLMRIAHKQSIGLIGAWQCMTRVPESLTEVESDDLTSALPHGYPNSIQHEFTAAETKQLLETSRSEQTTLNNLLASKLFIAIQQFRRECDNEKSRNWIRLSIPMNLRRLGANGAAAANYVSMVFLDRRPKEIDRSQALLSSIDRQMNRIKRLDLGLTLPLMLRLVKPLGIIPQMDGDEQCRSTAVLSNLMRPFADSKLCDSHGKVVTGNLKLENLEFMPPVRPKTNAAFGVLTYADRLCVTQHYDSRVMSESQARRLLDLYIKELHGSSGDA